MKRELLAMGLMVAVGAANTACGSEEKPPQPVCQAVGTSWAVSEPLLNGLTVAGVAKTLGTSEDAVRAGAEGPVSCDRGLTLTDIRSKEAVVSVTNTAGLGSLCVATTVNVPTPPQEGQAYTNLVVICPAAS